MGRPAKRVSRDADFRHDLQGEVMPPIVVQEAKSGGQYASADGNAGDRRAVTFRGSG